jgi:hypothetical protein
LILFGFYFIILVRVTEHSLSGEMAMELIRITIYNSLSMFFS